MTDSVVARSHWQCGHVVELRSAELNAALQQGFPTCRNTFSPAQVHIALGLQSKV